jgi:hypothetical protein
LPILRGDIGEDRDKAMLPDPQQRRGRPSDASWLSMLIDRFEETCRPNFRPVACDPRLLAALMAQLANPPMPQGGCGPRVRVLH